MIRVGLTGNYAMGKSTVAGMFDDLGAYIIEADKIVANLLQQPNVIAEIVDYFSENILTHNTINKQLLADIVFSNPIKRLQLENILHPKVFEQVEQTILSHPNEKVFIIEASLIFERALQNRFDKIITVYCDEATCIKRASEKQISEDALKKRWDCQLPIKQKINGADYVVDNSNDILFTKSQVSKIWEDLLQHADNNSTN